MISLSTETKSKCKDCGTEVICKTINGFTIPEYAKNDYFSQNFGWNDIRCKYCSIKYIRTILEEI